MQMVTRRAAEFVIVVGLRSAATASCYCERSSLSRASSQRIWARISR